MAFGAFGRQWIVWKAAWEADSDQLPHPSVAEGPAAEFLPEVLDIQRRPSSPVGRALRWAIPIVCLAVTGWAMFVRIDSITTAHGRVVPSGDSRSLYPSEPGMLTAIHVQVGQAVKRGEVLMELDSTRNISARDHTSKEYRVIQVEAARLRALLKHRARLEATADGDEDEIRVQQQLLQDQLTEHQARIAAAQHLVDERHAAVARTKTALFRGQAVLLMETERAEQSKKLMEQGVGARADFLQAESRRVEQGQEMIRQEKQLEQDQAALAEAEQESHTLAVDFQQRKQAELSALEAKAASLAQEVTTTGQKSGFQQVLSPIDGVVQQLVSHPVGTVVNPGQPLLVVVPPDRTVEIEAHVEKKDVGIIHQGQSVGVIVETFQIPSYGAIPGHVLTVSDDATSRKRGELVSPIRVRLDRSTVQVGGTEVTLAPGMAVRVEIKIGPRRISEYLLEPLLQSWNERAREWNELVYAVRGFLERRNL